MAQLARGARQLLDTLNAEITRLNRQRAAILEDSRAIQRGAVYDPKHAVLLAQRIEAQTREMEAGLDELLGIIQDDLEEKLQRRAATTARQTLEERVEELERRIELLIARR